MSNSFSIEKITDKNKKAFADVTRIIYATDTAWICPIDGHIESIFNPALNPCFQNGEACRWILKDTAGKLVGRIATFVDHRKNQHKPFPLGGVGFFECINNDAAATLLFDTAVAWLKEKNVEAMDGPINFGENDRYWGLLVEGFSAPAFTTNYNKPYYRSLFENYGFETYYEMFTHEMDLSKKMDSRFEEIASWLNKKNDVVFKHATVENLPEFAEYFREIYNDAWQFHDEFTPITSAQSQKLAKEMKHILIDSFCPFAFVRGEPAGFIISAPDLNQVFKSFNGKFSLWRKLVFKWRKRNNFLWYRKNEVLDKMHVIAIGVKPKFQQYGIETGMIMSTVNNVRNMGFKKVELRWAGDFNPKVIRLNEAVGAYRIRKHITLRYFFDQQKVEKYSKIPLGKRK